MKGRNVQSLSFAGSTPSSTPNQFSVSGPLLVSTVSAYDDVGRPTLRDESLQRRQGVESGLSAPWIGVNRGVLTQYVGGVSMNHTRYVSNYLLCRRVNPCFKNGLPPRRQAAPLGPIHLSSSGIELTVMPLTTPYIICCAIHPLHACQPVSSEPG